MKMQLKKKHSNYTKKLKGNQNKKIASSRIKNIFRRHYLFNNRPHQP